MHPDEHFATLASPPGQMARNNASVVLKAVYGDTSFLFTGDIMARGEQTLVTRFGDALSSTVMVAPHHGSRSSSSQGLVNAVRPAVVVISAGAGNRFGFPHDEVVRRYRAAGSQLLCTGSHGAVSMRSDGHQIHVRAEVNAES